MENEIKEKITETLCIKEITYNDTKRWLLEKHYAHRMPSISYSYGLFRGEDILGIVTYGSPPSQSLCRGICGDDFKKHVLELNRLVINSIAPHNSASYLVGRTLKMLPRDSIIVSYADTSMEHIGKIYQATNFIYTGLSDKRTEWKEKGKNTHSKSVCEMYGIDFMKTQPNRFEVVQRPRKHRYILFRNKKHLRNLKYPILPYPKGESKNYDCIDILENKLF